MHVKFIIFVFTSTDGIKCIYFSVIFFSLSKWVVIYCCLESCSEPNIRFNSHSSFFLQTKLYGNVFWLMEMVLGMIGELISSWKASLNGATLDPKRKGIASTNACWALCPSVNFQWAKHCWYMIWISEKWKIMKKYTKK